jgi:hypothetical protein
MSGGSETLPIPETVISVGSGAAAAAEVAIANAASRQIAMRFVISLR